MHRKFVNNVALLFLLILFSGPISLVRAQLRVAPVTPPVMPTIPLIRPNLELPTLNHTPINVSQVQQILCSSMQEFTPDIPIETSFLLADRWYKDVDEQPRDEQGRIVPYERLQHPCRDADKY